MKFYKLKVDFSSYDVPLVYTLVKGLREAMDPQLVKLYIRLLICLMQNTRNPVNIYKTVLNDFQASKNQNCIQFIYNLIKKGGKFELSK